MPQELWAEVCNIVVYNIVQEVVIKIIPKKSKCKKAKWMSEEALKIAEERREKKGKGERERYTQLNAVFPRIAKKDNEQCKEIEENNKIIEWEGLKISSRKLEISREQLRQKWAW